MIEQVEKRRIELGLTNDQLADILGIYPESWYRIKRTRQFGKKFLMNSMAFLANITDTPETTQNKKLARSKKRLGEIIGRLGKLWHNSREL